MVIAENWKGRRIHSGEKTELNNNNMKILERKLAHQRPHSSAAGRHHRHVADEETEKKKATTRLLCFLQAQSVYRPMSAGTTAWIKPTVVPPGHC